MFIWELNVSIVFEIVASSGKMEFAILICNFAEKDFDFVFQPIPFFRRHESNVCTVMIFNSDFFYIDATADNEHLHKKQQPRFQNCDIFN